MNCAPILLDMNTDVRSAEGTEIPQLARIWYDGWQDAHAEILPDELKQDRTLESFAERFEHLLPDTRACGPVGAPLGFCILKDDELYQLYVSSEARGKGVAAALMRDAEERLAESGVSTAWLACAIGNERAARFYEKSGWRRIGKMTNHLALATGPFELEVWRYEKNIGQAGT